MTDIPDLIFHCHNPRCGLHPTTGVFFIFSNARTMTIESVPYTLYHGRNPHCSKCEKEMTLIGFYVEEKLTKV